jgi:hypothetical protein
MLPLGYYEVIPLRYYIFFNTCKRAISLGEHSKAYKDIGVCKAKF